jgi:hypothetical protein
MDGGCVWSDDVQAAILQLCAFHADFEASRRANMSSPSTNSDDSGSSNGSATLMVDSRHLEMTGDEFNNHAMKLLMEAFERGGQQYGLAHNVTLKVAADLAELLLARRGFEQVSHLVDEVLNMAESEPVVATTSSSSHPSSSTPTDPNLPLPSSPSIAPLPLAPTLQQNSPFLSIYPSFPRQSRKVMLASLHRIKGQASEGVMNASSTADADQKHLRDQAIQMYESALKSFREELGDDHRYIRQTSYLLERLQQQPNPSTTQTSSSTESSSPTPPQ